MPWPGPRAGSLFCWRRLWCRMRCCYSGYKGSSTTPAAAEDCSRLALTSLFWGAQSCPRNGERPKATGFVDFRTNDFQGRARLFDAHTFANTKLAEFAALAQLHSPNGVHCQPSRRACTSEAGGSQTGFAGCRSCFRPLVERRGGAADSAHTGSRRPRPKHFD